MTIRRITIDISVKYIPQSEQIKEGAIKPNMIKNNSLRKNLKNFTKQKNH